MIFEKKKFIIYIQERVIRVQWLNSIQSQIYFFLEEAPSGATKETDLFRIFWLAFWFLPFLSGLGSVWMR